jgi:hypothetical protein
VILALLLVSSAAGNLWQWREWTNEVAALKKLVEINQLLCEAKENIRKLGTFSR